MSNRPGEEEGGNRHGAPMVLVPDYRGYANLGTGQYLLNHSAAGSPAELVISVATDEQKAGRVVGDERDNAPGAEVQPEDMAVRIRFQTVAGLDALEVRLRYLRDEHFPGTASAAPEPVMGGRESVEEALAVVEGFGPGIHGLNDTYARQILLADEVRRLRAALGAAAAAPGSTEPTARDELELRYVEACEERDHLRAQLVKLESTQTGASIAALLRDMARLDWMETMTVNVRQPLRYGSRDLFWASPEDVDGGPAGPSDIRAQIDKARAAQAQGGKA